MDRAKLNRLIEKYVRGNASPDEKRILNEWYEQFEETEGYLHQLNEVEKQQLENKLLSKIDEKIEDIPRRPSKLKTMINTWQKVAAALLIIMVAGGLFYRLGIYQPTTVYTTDYGETMDIVLPDSSKIKLNANSRLSYNNWDTEGRIVNLDGEAFFTVTRQSGGQKFRVKTDEVEVEVLGTSFNVNSYRKRTQVVLSEGKIILKDNSRAREFLMKPGEFLECYSNRERVVQKMVKPEQYTSWRNNLLEFDGTPLKEIGLLLENTYGYEVIFENQILMEKKFFGAAPADNINNLLDKLSKIYDVEISKNKNRIIFKD